MTIRFLIGVLAVLAACESEDERKARQLEESRRMVSEAVAKVRDAEEARLAGERQALGEEQAQRERFDTVMAGRRLVQRGLEQDPDPMRTCERIVDDAAGISLLAGENGLEEILGRACQAGDARARACIAHVADEIHHELGLARHLDAVTRACVQHDPKAFSLPE
jgi:hypothetical protein